MSRGLFYIALVFALTAAIYTNLRAGQVSFDEDVINIWKDESNIHVTEDIYCMAEAIYFEAGNQPVAGKIAVSQVVINRTQHMNYPSDICGVVYQAKWKENWKGNMMPVRHQCQFSWFCDGKSDDPEDSKTWVQCLTLARNILQGAYGDITEGATHYHSVYVNPYWADSLNETVIINEHIFYK